MSSSKADRSGYAQKAKELVSQMSLEEKVYLMSGRIKHEEAFSGEVHYNITPYLAGGNERLGLPPVKFCDGPRGVVCGTGKSTCFPVSMLRGAAFDTKLEEDLGHAIGREVRAHGGNLFAGVCINLPYNPGWGRSQETYGEDSFAIGQMGSALVRGVLEENVIPCVKHFAFNSMELSRFKCSVDCQRRTEREVYLPHFKDCIDAGAACVMSAYNLYKGVHCGHSDYLLSKILKEEWDFDGFVMSDFNFGIRDTVQAANAGLDMEMCWTYLYGENLVRAVRDGLVHESRIDEAAVRIAKTVLAFEDAYAKSGKVYGEEVLGCKEHKALALTAAREGITLIKNRSVLPLDRAAVKKLAVIGKLADRENTGDHGSSRVYPAYTVTPLEGIKTAAPGIEIIYCDGSDTEAAKKAAREADAVVFVVGFDYYDEGEYIELHGEEVNYFDSMGGDRLHSLSLHEADSALIKAVSPENENSVAVLIGGNTITVSEWIDLVPAVLMAYYPGQEGGTAIAEILFGDVNPSGKLPFVIPVSESDLPRVNWDTANQWYDYYHGYAKLDKEAVKPLFPYGFGMSYTDFEISGAHFEVVGSEIAAECTVKNSGSREGAEVIQLYIGFDNSAVDRPVKALRGFERVGLKPGESRRVRIVCPVDKLKWYNPTSAAFELEHMAYQAYIGTSSAQEDLLGGSFIL